MTGERRAVPLAVRRAVPLAVRLAAAFLAVAVTAVAVLAVLIVLSTRREVAGLVERQHEEDAEAVAAAVAVAYETAGGWNGAQLFTAAAIAARSEAGLTVTTADGRVVPTGGEAMVRMMECMHGVRAGTTPSAGGEEVTAPVVVAGSPVGQVTLTFPADSLPAPERQMREALGRTAVTGAAAAAGLALLAALFVAARVTRPIRALTGAAVRLAGGDRSARAGATGAPGELGELAAAFDTMADSLEREDDLRRALVADVAHELRTPLTILQAQTEALVDGVSPADQPTLRSLHEEVLRLTRLVADLETLAAADAARLHLETGRVDLAGVAAAAADEVRTVAAANGTTITVEAGPAQASGDAGRLHQVALNLLANAVKFSPAGGDVGVRSWTDAAGAHLEVADAGPGLAPGEEERVFDRFFQGQAGKAAGGSGIGLAVARELAVAHGGTITAANRSGGGARFTLTVPAAPNAGGAETSTPP